MEIVICVILQTSLKPGKLLQYGHILSISLQHLKNVCIQKMEPGFANANYLKDLELDSVVSNITPREYSLSGYVQR